MMNNSSDQKRSVAISGKISPALNRQVYELLDGVEFKTKNDVLEKALIQLTESKRKKRVEGC